MRLSRRALLKASAASAVLSGVAAPYVARAQTAEFSYKYANNLPDAHPMNARARDMAAAIKGSGAFANPRMLAQPTTGPTPMASAAGSGVTPVRSNPLRARRSRYGDPDVRPGADDEEAMAADLNAVTGFGKATEQVEE